MFCYCTSGPPINTGCTLLWRATTFIFDCGCGGIKTIWELPPRARSVFAVDNWTSSDGKTKIKHSIMLHIWTRLVRLGETYR